MTKKNLLAKQILALLLALCLSSCTGTIQLSLHTSDGLPAMARIDTPDDGERLISLPGSISISRSSRKPLRVYVQEDEITAQSSQEIVSIRARAIKYCGNSILYTPLGVLMALLPPLLFTAIRCENSYIKKISSIVIDVERKTQPKGDKPSVYSAPGSITGVKYE